MVVARAWRKKKVGSDYLMGTASPFGMKKMFWSVWAYVAAGLGVGRAGTCQGSHSKYGVHYCSSSKPEPCQ